MDTYPTYIYIKRHKISGLKYLGKTTKSNVESYKGSGVYWKKHLKKYGVEHVETLWVSEPFYDKNLLVEFSTFLSDFLDVQNSEEWANLIIENGLDGAPKGVNNSGPLGEKNGMFGKTKEKNPFYGRKHSVELKEKWRNMRLGENNPNFGGKSWTKESIEKLRKPKSNKENYKGSPGKITCIDKNGQAQQISTELYRQQKQSGLPMCEWEYVNTNSRVAADRKKMNSLA